ncbi:50S ribosomal protein L24 [archaeon]|nr:50S ribosomal protein L24 [archaeon]
MIKSKNPSKQRAYRRKAPIHTRRIMMSSRLSSDLRKKHKKKSVPVRKDDEVIVLRGSFKGSKGKVEEVKRSSYKVFIDSVYREKKDGSKVKIGVDASNLMITSLNLNDVKRLRGESK